MSGPLGKAPVTSDIAFFLEIAVIIILFFGRFRLARRQRLVAHGYTTMSAVILHACSVALVMIPSLAISLDLLADLQNPTIIITWIHVPIGLTALILGIFLVTVWRFRPPATSCFKRKRLMRPLFWLWTLSVTLGILIYLSIALG
jgi:cytochrome bd-type quinol oxidase subunit 1